MRNTLLNHNNVDSIPIAFDEKIVISEQPGNDVFD